MSLFADDANIFSESNIYLQFTLYTIYKWLKARKLDLNPNKRKILTIKKNKPCPIDLLPKLLNRANKSLLNIFFFFSGRQ